jgi:GntR family histidine utilization transcriptional repressor
MHNPVRKLKTIAGEDPSLPQYERIRRYVLHGISSGAWPDGVRIPSEHELVELFGVSRMTVNRALRELTTEGILVRVQGVGTFAAKLSKAQSTLLSTQDISEEIRQRGHTHSCRVVKLQKRKPSTHVLGQLDLPAESAVFYSLIVHYENAVPVQLEERFVNPAIAPHYLNQDFTNTTTHRYLIDCATITEMEHIIHAVICDDREQRLLQTRAHEPCLLLLRRTWSGRTVATFSRFIYPGERYALGARFKVAGEQIASAGHLTLAQRLRR